MNWDISLKYKWKYWIKFDKNKLKNNYIQKIRLPSITLYLCITRINKHFLGEYSTLL